MTTKCDYNQYHHSTPMPMV